MATPQALPSGEPRKSASQSLITPSTISIWARTGRTHRYPCGNRLYFQIRPNSAAWIFRFRFGGARRSMGLGAYPEVGLALAREKADRAWQALREGRDPIAEREAGATQAQAPKSLVKWVGRKWPGVPAEFTSDMIALWQEIGSLRRKVTLLEQERAQPRPMAKAARQEGLAMKASKAALTKPNGGVVGIYDPKLDEYYEADSPPPGPLQFRWWFPSEARPKIEMMWEDTLPDKEVRMALGRLVTDPRMRPVWKEKLRNVKGVEEIIPEAIDALKEFALARPPPQSKRREARQRYQQHFNKLWTLHPHPTGEFSLMTCVNSAALLQCALERLRTELAPYSDEEWSRYWQGDPAMKSIDAVISSLAALKNCLEAMEKEEQQDFKRLPPITHLDSRAQHRFFAQIMANKMRELCGRPRHDVVAVLVRVAFDLDDDDVKTGTVQEWCRLCSRQGLQN